MSRRVFLRGPLFATFLCAAVSLGLASPGGAAPTIESYHIQLDALVNPDAYWHESVSIRVHDPLGPANIVEISITDPEGTLHSGPCGSGETWERTDEPDYWVNLRWWKARANPPMLGPYVLRARNAQGQEAVLETSPTPHVPEPVPHLTYPTHRSVLDETTPVFLWDPYPGFAGPGGPAWRPTTHAARVPSAAPRLARS